MMTKPLVFLPVPVIIAFSLTCSLALLTACAPGDVAEYQNPWEYDIEEFKDVDPALLRYQEIRRLTFDATELHAVAAGADGRIYVSGDSSVAVFAGDLLESRLELEAPATCLAVGAAGHLYLGMGDYLQVMSPDRSRSRSWPRLGKRSLITSIAVNPDHVFVADAGNRVVLRYDHDGKPLGRIGEKDPERDIPGFLVPSPYFDLAIDSAGQLWVVNPGLHTLESYSPEGHLRHSWGHASMEIDGFCGCCNPIHLAMLGNGSFVTSEKGLPRVKVLAATGELQAVVAGPRQLSEEADHLDLAVDSNGRILVLDAISSAVRVFSPKSEEGGQAS